MTVIAFVPRPLPQCGAWQPSELNEMQRTFAAKVDSGEASGWAIGATEVGDPQFYLLGTPPDEECILAISRVGRVYILEDGAGHVVYEDVNFAALCKQAEAFLSEAKASIIARVTVLWGALRHSFEEKIEPILAEGEELLMHVAPQLVAVA
jgi:hypothetical protein